MMSDTESAYSGHTTLSASNTGDSSSYGGSIESGSSRKGTKGRTIDFKKRGIWSSLHEHILVTMASSMGNVNYTNYALTDVKEGGTVLQVFAAYLLVGIPASYMQMVLGQFTHMGVFLLKRMVPVADGVGFSYCLTIFFLSMLSVLELQSIVLYLVLTFVPGDLQWSTCGAKNCWEVNKVCNISRAACIDKVVHVAAYVYWNETFMSGLSRPSDRRLGHPIKEAVLVCLALWIFIYLLTLVSLLRLKKIVRHMTVIHLLVKTCMACGLLIKAGIVRAFTHMTMASITNFNYFSAWVEAVQRVVVVMTLGDFSHVMMGALGSDSTKIGIVAFLSGIISFSSIFIDDVIVNSASIALCDRLNLPLDDRYLLFHPSNAPLYLTVLPTSFEILPYPRLWNMLYFANKIMAILFRIIFNVHFLLEAISHRFPTLSTYKKYSTPMFCILAWSFGIIIQSHRSYEIRANFQRITVFICQYFNVCFFAAMVSYVYGVRRFCDDIHFLRQTSAPNLYWKIAWLLLPVILACTIRTHYLNRRYAFFKESIIEIILMFSPYLVLTTFEIIKKIVERRTITLITPEPKWGPREIERRTKRRQFNPRKSTRYIIDVLQCHHVCIMNNKILNSLVAKEAQIMGRLGGSHMPKARTSSMDMISTARFSLEDDS